MRRRRWLARSKINRTGGTRKRAVTVGRHCRSLRRPNLASARREPTVFRAVIGTFGLTAVQLGITTNPARGKCTTISPARSS
jgi:hypothetical protein